MTYTQSILDSRLNVKIEYFMVPDYTRAGIIKHLFFKPRFEDIYGMELEFFSYRPIDTIDLNFYGCSISFLQP